MDVKWVIVVCALVLSPSSSVDTSDFSLQSGNEQSMLQNDTSEGRSNFDTLVEAEHSESDHTKILYSPRIPEFTIDRTTSISLTDKAGETGSKRGRKGKQPIIQGRNKPQESHNEEQDSAEEEDEQRTRDDDEEEHQTMNPNPPRSGKIGICESPQCTCSSEKVAVCTCDEANKKFEFKHTEIPEDLEELQVKECDNLRIKSDALIRQTCAKQLRNVSFENIKLVIIERQGLNLPKRTQCNIVIRSSAIHLIEKGSFRGFSGTLTFNNVTISQPIPNGCFQNLNLTSFIIEQSNLTSIGSESFQNCEMGKFELRKSTIHTLNGTWTHLSAKEVMIRENNIDSIYGKSESQTKKLRQSTYSFLNNTVQNAYEKAFTVKFKEDVMVIVDGNVFGYVQSQTFVTAKSAENKMKLENNQFNSYEKGAISGKIGIEQLKLPDKCGCNTNILQYLQNDDQLDRETNTARYLCVDHKGKHVPIQNYQRSKECRYGVINKLCDVDFCLCNFDSDGKQKIECICQQPNEVLELTKNPGTELIPLNTSELVIAGCENVIFRTDALSELKDLEKLSVHEVKEVSIETKGIYIPLTTGQRVAIHFENVKVSAQSGSFTGSFGELLFRNVTLLNMMAKTFSDLTAKSFEAVDCTFGQLRKEAFKKCNITSFRLTGSHFDFVNNRAVTVNRAEKVAFNGNNFGTLDTRSIHLFMSRRSAEDTSFSFTNNKVGVMNQYALTTESQTIRFSNNTFGHVQGNAFYEIKLTLPSSAEDFAFEDNEFRNISENAFAMSQHVAAKRLKLNFKCLCNFVNDGIFGFIRKPKANDQLEQTIDADAGAKQAADTQLNAIECLDGSYGSYTSYKLYHSTRCEDSKNYMTIAIVLAFVLIVVVIVIVIVVRCLLRQLKQKKKKTEKLEEQITTLHIHGPSIWGRRLKIEEEERKTCSTTFPDLIADNLAETQVTYNRTHSESNASTLRSNQKTNVYLQLKTHEL